MLRYEIRSSKKAEPGDVHLLERAFARVAADRSDTVRDVTVSGRAGGFVIAMDVAASPRRAERDCERLFAAAWYDAFGRRGSTHIGRLVGEPVSRLRRMLVV